MSGSDLEPIKLHEKWYWKPLEIGPIQVPREDITGPFVVPIMVDWFDLPEWTYFWNEGRGSPHFFGPNLISLKLKR